MELTWRLIQLQKIATEIGDGLHGTPFYSSTGMYAFINGSNISRGHIVYKTDTKYVDEQEFSKYRKPLSKRTLLLSINGTLGNVAEYNGEKVILGKSACYINVAEGVNCKFVKHVLSSPAFQEYLVRFSTGTTIKNASLQQIREYTFLLPPLQVQDAIASTLSCLDDKIELNTRIIANLETQAQAIFKSWFVDFEPFQDGEFEDSELGLIPKGWRVGTLSDIADITMGQSPKGESFSENEIGTVFYQGRAEFGFRFPTRRLFTTEPVRMAQSGDILLSVRAPVGDINVATEECCIGRGLSAIHSSNGCKSFLLYSIKQMHDILDQYNGEGTVFGSINRKDLNQLTVLIPSQEAMQSFNNLVVRFDCEILNLHNENLRLETIRDALLPKLMSGEIEVPVSL